MSLKNKEKINHAFSLKMRITKIVILLSFFASVENIVSNILKWVRMY